MFNAVGIGEYSMARSMVPIKFLKAPCGAFDFLRSRWGGTCRPTWTLSPYFFLPIRGSVIS